MARADQAEKAVKPRILVAPLDWGLGHATRCIPIIRELMVQGAEVCIAGEGAQQRLLQQEFPHLQFLELPGYRVRYGKSGPQLVSHLLYQAPSILRSIRDEQQWLHSLLATERIDGLISDNRYGLHHPALPSIFITHQLLIKTPWGRLTDQLLQRKNYQYIEKFSACWVPDTAAAPGLAGELSHPAKRPRVPLSYIGPLSRFEKRGHKGEEDLLIIISGPEPQRSLFEALLLPQLSATGMPALLVRGLPEATELPDPIPNISMHNHLSAEALEAEIDRAGLVIARSGYSTVMDLARMGKKAVFVPTPGQTEQEYLARQLDQNKMAYSFTQKEFNLVGAISTAQSERRLREPQGENRLPAAIAKLLEMARG